MHTKKPNWEPCCWKARRPCRGFQRLICLQKITFLRGWLFCTVLCWQPFYVCESFFFDFHVKYDSIFCKNPVSYICKRIVNVEGKTNMYCQTSSVLCWTAAPVWTHTILAFSLLFRRRTQMYLKIIYKACSQRKRRFPVMLRETLITWNTF